jgi:hypothetical protein
VRRTLLDWRCGCRRTTNRVIATSPSSGRWVVVTSFIVLIVDPPVEIRHGLAVRDGRKWAAVGDNLKSPALFVDFRATIPLVPWLRPPPGFHRRRRISDRITTINIFDFLVGAMVAMPVSVLAVGLAGAL